MYLKATTALNEKETQGTVDPEQAKFLTFLVTVHIFLSFLCLDCRDA